MTDLSAIVITPDSLATVSRTLSCLRTQTVAAGLEVVLVGPEPAVREAEAERAGRGFGGFRTVIAGGSRLTTEARAAGVRAATSPLIVFTEDHSWPEPGWAEALLGAHRAGCLVAGPAVLNANPHSVLSWANFIVEYSEWMVPCSTTSTAHLPGHNSSYQRALLLGLGDGLAAELEAETLLHWQFSASGSRLTVAADAVTRHLNFSQVWPSLCVRLNSGHLFAGMRRRRWAWWRRLAYAAGAPLIPVVRFARILRRVRQPGRSALVPWLSYPMAFGLLAVDAAGECLGYLRGPGRAAERISAIDFHRESFLNRRDRARLDASPA
jgi:hypothetical protein